MRSMLVASTIAGPGETECSQLYILQSSHRVWSMDVLAQRIVRRTMTTSLRPPSFSHVAISIRGYRASMEADFATPSWPCDASQLSSPVDDCYCCHRKLRLDPSEVRPHCTAQSWVSTYHAPGHTAGSGFKDDLQVSTAC